VQRFSCSIACGPQSSGVAATPDHRRGGPIGRQDAENARGCSGPSRWKHCARRRGPRADRSGAWQSSSQARVLACGGAACDARVGLRLAIGRCGTPCGSPVYRLAVWLETIIGGQRARRHGARRVWRVPAACACSCRVCAQARAEWRWACGVSGFRLSVRGWGSTCPTAWNRKGARSRLSAPVSRAISNILGGCCLGQQKPPRAINCSGWHCHDRLGACLARARGGSRRLRATGFR
jgi:hypothetical protein